MDEIRRAISDRLAELQLSESWLSKQLGRNRGYMNEYFNGSPADLTYEQKLEVARLLKLEPRALGIAPVSSGGSLLPANAGGFGEQDAEPFLPPDGHYLARLPHVAYFRMKSRALDQHRERILPGRLLAFDLNRTKPVEIPDMEIVVAQVYDKRELTRSFGTIVRCFMSPNKLITNSSEFNSIISLDDDRLPFDVVIKGTRLAVIGDAN